MYKSQNSCQFQAEISGYGSCLFGGKPLKNQFNDLKLPISQAEKAVKPRRFRLTFVFRTRERPCWKAPAAARWSRSPRPWRSPGGEGILRGSCHKNGDVMAIIDMVHLNVRDIGMAVIWL